MAPPAAVISARICSSKRALCAAAAGSGRRRSCGLEDGIMSVADGMDGWVRERIGCFTTGAGSGADPPLITSLGTHGVFLIPNQRCKQATVVENMLASDKFPDPQPF